MSGVGLKLLCLLLGQCKLDCSEDISFIPLVESCKENLPIATGKLRSKRSVTKARAAAKKKATKRSPAVEAKPKSRKRNVKKMVLSWLVTVLISGIIAIGFYHDKPNI